MSIKITEEGKTLLEDAILQDKKVVFSQIELIADVEKSPTEMVKRVDVSKVSASDYNTITVQAQIDNDGFLDTYYFNRANVYADEVLFAYDDGINICIPAETTKVINDLEMMMKIDSAVADLKIIYEGYVLRKDFNDMESKIQKINTTIKDMEANAVTQNDCTDQVSWNSQIVKKEFLTIGNMAFFRATGGFSTSRGSIVLATIPQGYFPETTGNQSSYELMGVFTSAYDKERRNCYVTLNCLSGNVDLQINNNEAYSDTRADDNVQMIFYGFWKMNTESQGGTGGSISYREDIEKLRQSIQDSKKEIVRSSREIDSLKEDLSNSNLIDIFEKKITTTTDKWDRPISFRHIWFPFTAKVNCNIKSISFNCLVNNDYIDSSNKFHCELLRNDGKTIIASATTGYEWVNNSTFVNFSFDLNGMIHKGGNYYLHIYCLTRSFSYTLTEYKNVYEDDYILSSPPTRVNNAGNATFEQSGTNDMIRLFVSMSISGKNITDISEIKDNIVNVKSDISEIKGIEPIKLYVSKSGSDITGDGSKEKPYASIFHANESIIDSSAEKPYKIIVAKGTYTDLQEKYAGDTTTGSYKGVNVKDHIYIESEDIEHPELTVLEWDGFTGFTSETYTEKIRSDMCLFHFNGRKASRKWASGLKGFTLRGSNTRYLFHIEANSDQNILIENCIFDWNGTPKGQYHNIPVVGCGGSFNQAVTFKNCIFRNSESTAGVQWHDNAYPYSDLNIYHGASFSFIGCKFDGLDLQMRSTNAEREMPFSLIVEKCGGIRKAVFSQGGSATKNYWRGHVVSSFIAEDKISNATDDTNEVTPFEKK